MKYKNIFIVVLLFSCQEKGMKSGSVPFSDCIYALVGCGDDFYNTDLIGTVGSISDHEKEIMKQTHQSVQDAATVDYYNNYLSFLQTLAPNSQIVQDLKLDTSQPNFWNAYMKSLQNYFQKEKEEKGQLSNHVTRISTHLDHLQLNQFPQIIEQQRV